MLHEDILKSLPLDPLIHPVISPVLAEIFDAIPFQIVIKSLREENFGEFLVWNKATEAILGIPASEALGKRDIDFFPAEQATFFAERDREVIRNHRPQVTSAEQIVSRTRGIRTIRTTKTPIFDAHNQPVALLAVSEDITDHQSAEVDLQRALDALVDLNSQLPGAVYQFLVDTEGRTSFPYVSEGIRLITEDSAQEIMAGTVKLLSRILPEDLPLFLSHIAISRREMSTCRQEFRVRTRTGQIRWALSNSSPKKMPDGSTLWHGFVSDITSFKEASAAVQRGEERLHQALSATKAAVWEYNLETSILFLTPEWANIFGFPIEFTPITLPDFLDKFHPEDRSIWKRIEENTMPGAENQLEFRHLLGDGGYSWALLSEKPVYDEEGLLIGRVGTILDISERKRIEQQLIEAKESAERASQSKGQFLAMMSHEIRTPLNAVLGFSDLLGSTKLSPEQEEYLLTIRDNSSALLVILNDVLDYSKIESGRLDLDPLPCDIARLVRSTVDFFRPQATARGLKMHVVSTPGGPRSLLCDSARLSQVLHNLLSNAIKFTERGAISVELTFAPASTTRWDCTLRVRDTGIGIDLNNHPSLFDPFYQADNSTQRRFGGTGLGLAIVRRLIGLMGGSIGVQSAPGRGSTFTIHLSLETPPEPEAISEAEAKRMSINLSALAPRILVVEDNPTNRRLVKLFLKNLGHSADEAENGFQGVEKARAFRYDVIFMDLEMPGMDGYEATRRIREMITDHSPFIVALTAHAMPEHRQRSLEAGMNAYLSKPVKKENLASVLKTALLG